MQLFQQEQQTCHRYRSARFCRGNARNLSSRHGRAAYRNGCCANADRWYTGGGRVADRGRHAGTVA
jgi:hypothetical protein